MKFDGKQLFELGIPKNKIKFFIGRDFNSTQELLDELNPKDEVIVEKVYTWVDWVWERFKRSDMPMKMNGTNPELMSKSELKRLFDSKSIEINGMTPISTERCDESSFPITSFIWFPKGKRLTRWF